MPWSSPDCINLLTVSLRRDLGLRPRCRFRRAGGPFLRLLTSLLSLLPEDLSVWLKF